MTLKEMFGISSEYTVSPSAVIGNSMGLKFRQLTTVKAQKTSENMLRYIGAQDDNIVVPMGTKTLLGEDFESLYPETKTETMKDTNGEENSYIVSTDKAYQTEMHALTAGHWTSYDLCGTRARAVYEMTLVSKKYAYEYQTAKGDAKQQSIDDYTTTMAFYKQFCEENDIGWGQVLQDVSAELQVESYDYAETSHKLVGDIVNRFGKKGVNWDENRIIANRAHLMVKGVMPEGTEDQLATRLVGKTTYEKTLDTNIDEDTTLSARVALAFKSAYEKVRDFVKNSFPVKIVGGAVGGVVGTFKNLGSKFSNASKGNELSFTSTPDNQNDGPDI